LFGRSSSSRTVAQSHYFVRHRWHTKSSVSTRRTSTTTTATIVSSLSSQSTSNKDQSTIFSKFPPNTRNVMAPMVAASDYPYRCLLRQYGVDLCYMQMLHSRNLVQDKVFRRTHLDLLEYRTDKLEQEEQDEEVLMMQPYDTLLPQQKLALEGLDETDRMAAQQRLQTKKRFQDTTTTTTSTSTANNNNNNKYWQKGPLMAQLAGSNVDDVLSAAKLLMESTEGKLTGIDFNLGCPQQIAKKGNYGAFFMEADLDQVCRILTSLSEWMARHYPTSYVSAKIRLPVDDEILVRERIPRLLQTGISFLTIHGRTIHENKTKVQACHVNRIKRAVDTCHQIQPKFPVVTNGGIESYPDVAHNIRETNAIAVMSSEALLERPNVFMESSVTNSPHERFQQQMTIARDYIDWCLLSPPAPGVLGDHGSFSIAKGHMFKFVHPYLQEHSDLRDALGMPQHVGNVRQLHVWLNELEARYAMLRPEEFMELSSSQKNASWYRRHRNAQERVHTRQVGGAKAPRRTDSLMTVQERKELARQRIAKLKEQRISKETVRANL